KAIIKDPIAFLKESLELINHSSNKEPVRSLSYQRRVWDYKKEGFGKLENLGERQYLLCLTKFNGFFPDVKNQKPNLLKNASFNQAEEEFKILGSPKFWEGDWDAVYYYYDSNSIDLSLSLLNQEVYQDVLLDEKEKLQNLKFKVYIYSFGSIRIEYFYRDDLLYSVVENTDTYDSWQTLNVDYPLNGKKIDRVRVILTNKTNKKSLFYRPELVGLN
ncbi:MAG: hypothetical protein KDD56_07305, partial [Bdellovibrionales bacterium]|nr:hypothetical protein [Bdellovibrionales bacterium]